MRPPTKLRRVPAWAALVVGILVLAACGSTAPRSGQDALRNLPSSDGLGGPAPEGSLAAPGSSLDGGFGGGTGLGGTGGALGIPTVPGGGSLSVPGITATTIYVGASYQTDQGAANQAVFGAGDNDTGDARDYYNVVIKEINAQGGIAGRKIVPIFHELKAASTQTVDQQLQAGCEKWTVENKVFAILESGRPAITECSKKAGVLAFGEVSASLPETFTRYPNYVEISGLNLVREGNITVDGLVREGYFEPGARIGIVTWDDPYYKAAVERGYIPALKRHGLKLATEPVYVHTPTSAGDLGPTGVDASGAVLKFSSEDITHVILQDGTAGVCAGGCLTIVFTREAEGQRYRPRYGFNTDNEPQAGIDAKLYPSEQLRRSLAVLWSDFDERADAGIKKNAARERCYALMAKAGLTLDNVNAQASALAVCGELWFMQAVVRKISGALTVASFMDGVNRLGYEFNDPTVYATHFSPSQHDGNGAARNARFEEDCPGPAGPCYVFTTGIYQV